MKRLRRSQVNGWERLDAGFTQPQIALMRLVIDKYSEKFKVVSLPTDATSVVLEVKYCVCRVHRHRIITSKQRSPAVATSG